MITLTKYEQSGMIFTDTLLNQSFGVDLGVFSKAQIGSIPSLKAMFVSHIHGDHYNLDLIKASKAESIFAAREVQNDLSEHDVHAGLIVVGDMIGIGAIEAEVFEVDHGPISKPISNLGFHFKLGGKNILFCGDMKVAGSVPDAEYDVTLIPVCGGDVIMNFEEAIQFLQYLRHPGIVIPVHYHGRADPETGQKFFDFAHKLFQIKVLDVNQSLELV